jgi:hypothetical protein
VRVHCAHSIFRIEPARYTGLVGHNKHEQSRIVECLDRCFRASNLAKSFDLANISIVMVQDAVAIEEGRGPAPALGDFAKRPREVIMHANINKITVVGDTK